LVETLTGLKTEYIEQNPTPTPRVTLVNIIDMVVINKSRFGLSLITSQGMRHNSSVFVSSQNTIISDTHLRKITQEYLASKNTNRNNLDIDKIRITDNFLR